jgi:hypothetical protein
MNDLVRRDKAQLLGISEAVGIDAVPLTTAKVGPGIYPNIPDSNRYRPKTNTVTHVSAADSTSAPAAQGLFTAPDPGNDSDSDPIVVPQSYSAVKHVAHSYSGTLEDIRDDAPSFAGGTSSHEPLDSGYISDKSEIPESSTNHKPLDSGAISSPKGSVANQCRKVTIPGEPSATIPSSKTKDFHRTAKNRPKSFKKASIVEQMTFEDKTPTTTMVRIDGHAVDKAFSACLDTGSSISLIDRGLLKKHCPTIKTTPSSTFEVKGIGSNVTISESVDLKIIFEDVEGRRIPVPIKFYVTRLQGGRLRRRVDASFSAQTWKHWLVLIYNYSNSRDL